MSSMPSQTCKRTPRYGLHRSAPAEESREHDLWHRNQESSLLLRLPPEIRNRIYAYVLTVGQINVRYKPWEHKRRIKNGQRYTETIPGGFWIQILDAETNPWEVGAVGSRDRITLLSPVCRQLYKETAVLPFKLNPWSFENTYVMERYVLKEKRLSLLQRRAIQTLFVRENLSRAMEKYFGGLKVIIWKSRKKLRKQILDADPDVGRRSRAVWRDRDWYLYS